MPFDSAAPDAPSIALLDSEKVLLDSLSRLLSAEGMRVVAACSSAEELLPAVRAEGADVLIADVRFWPPASESPADHAWGLLQLIRMHQPRMRIVILSGSSDPAEIQRAEEARVSAFLTKDQVTVADVVATISRVMRGERLFPLFPTAASAPSPASAPLSGLSARELEVLRHVGAGYDNLKIAACLGITERTVRAHVSSLYRKLGPENRAQLALLSRELGLRPPDA